MAIYKRGDIWYIDYYVEGRRFREGIGPSRKMAERALAKRKTEVAENCFFDIKRRPKTTFEQLAAEYIDYAKVNKLSWERDQRSIAVLSHWFAGKHLYEITPLALENLKTQRRQQVGSATINRELACLKHMFTKAIQWDMATTNPVKKVKLLRESRGRLRYLTIEEVGRLLEQSADHLKPILITALYTGMRKSEILRLTWNDLDFTHRIIYVLNTKNGESREIPMADPVFQALSQLPVCHKRVFTQRNGLPVDSIRTAFDNAVVRARINDFSFHDLRHTFASHLVMNGVDLLTVKELLGHKTINMTLRYAHLSPSHKRKAVETLKYFDSHKTVTKPEVTVIGNGVSRYPANDAGVVEWVDTRDLKSLASS